MGYFVVGRSKGYYSDKKRRLGSYKRRKWDRARIAGLAYRRKRSLAAGRRRYARYKLSKRQQARQWMFRYKVPRSIQDNIFRFANM